MESGFLKRVVLGTIGTVLLGAVGSGIWELVFAPGVDWFGRVLTSLSQSIDDASYSSAALDPSPLPSLILLLLVTQVPVWLASYVFAVELSVPLLRRLLPRPDPSQETRKAFLARANRIRRFTVLILILFLGGVYLVARAGFSVANQAVLVWRVFHTNLARCAPHLTSEEEVLRAQFRTIETERQYLALHSQLTAVAQRYGIRLEVVEPE